MSRKRPQKAPNPTLQRTGGAVAMPTLLVHTWVAGGFAARRSAWRSVGRWQHRQVDIHNPCLVSRIECSNFLERVCGPFCTRREVCLSAA